MSKKRIRCCQGNWCTQYGAKEVLEAVEKHTGLKAGEKNDRIDLDICRCLDYCSSGPNIEVTDQETGKQRIIFYARPETIGNELEKGGTPINKTTTGNIEDIIHDDFLGDI